MPNEPTILMASGMTSVVVCASRYTGKERDTESGNDYFPYRYYSSSMGRFMSPDPTGGLLANPQTLNKYAYAVNNPLSFVDPTGLWHCAWNAVSGDGSDKDDTEANGGASSSDCFSQGGEAWESDPEDGMDLSYNGADTSAPDLSGTSLVPASNVPGSNDDGMADNPLADALFHGGGRPYWGAANRMVNYATAGTAIVYGGAIAGMEYGLR